MFWKIIWAARLRTKKGVYIWINKTNNKKYIESSKNLSMRLGKYYNSNFLKKSGLTNKSLIYKAILRYGIDMFELQILKYCNSNDKESLLRLEQYFLVRSPSCLAGWLAGWLAGFAGGEALKPEYNILKIAGSTAGFKHSSETLMKLQNRKLSAEALSNLIKAKKGKAPTSLLRKEKHLLSISKKIMVINTTLGLLLLRSSSTKNVFLFNKSSCFWIKSNASNTI